MTDPREPRFARRENAPDGAHRGPMPRRRRIGRLLAAAAAGAALALLGQALFGGDAWWLALPAAMALAWWRVADPTACEPPRR